MGLLLLLLALVVLVGGGYWRLLPLAYHVRVFLHVAIPEWLARARGERGSLRRARQERRRAAAGGGGASADDADGGDASFGPMSTVGLLDGVVQSFRCLPADMDFNFHMNNASYNAVADLGRGSLLFRAGLIPAARAKGWRLGLGGMQMLFRREIKPFEAFQVHSRIRGFDAKWIYIEQRFIVHRKATPSAATATPLLAALGIAKFALKHKRDDVPWKDMWALLGEEAPPPHHALDELDPMSADLRAAETRVWKDAERDVAGA